MTLTSTPPLLRVLLADDHGIVREGLKMVMQQATDLIGSCLLYTSDAADE